MIKIRETNHMEYQEGMEQIDHSIMNKVLEMTDKYDYSKYTAWDVRNVLSKDSIDINDLAVLLSPAAEPMLEQMAQRAKTETAKHFGNTVCMFSHRCILQITVKITVFTVVSTVLIKLKEESFQWKRSKRSTKLFQKPDFVKFFCLQESQKPLLQLNILQTL